MHSSYQSNSILQRQVDRTSHFVICESISGLCSGRIAQNSLQSFLTNVQMVLPIIAQYQGPFARAVNFTDQVSVAVVYSCCIQFPAPRGPPFHPPSFCNWLRNFRPGEVPCKLYRFTRRSLLSIFEGILGEVGRCSILELCTRSGDCSPAVRSKYLATHV